MSQSITYGDESCQRSERLDGHISSRRGEGGTAGSVDVASVARPGMGVVHSQNVIRAAQPPSRVDICLASVEGRAEPITVRSTE